MTFTALAPDRFDPQASVAARAVREQFLLQVLLKHGTDFPEDLLVAALREAEALAGLTPFPGLFLPSLAEEKVERLQDWWTRQQRIRAQEHSFPA